LNKTFKNKNRAIERYEKSEERKNLIIGHKNFKKLFGFPYENIVLLKIFCGDASDEIKNVKGVTENTLFGIVPDLHEKVLTIEEIKSNCLNFLNQKDVLKEDKLFLKERGLHLPTALKACKNIIEGTETIEINQRIIDLSNQEFITNECKESLEASEFLSKNLFKPFDSQGMVNKMTKIGLTEHINLRMKDVKYFFKPFLKTFNLPK
jgi:5'-3' exonuclease